MSNKVESIMGAMIGYHGISETYCEHIEDFQSSDKVQFTCSFVTISDDLIKKVAERCCVSEEEIRKYLSSSEQNDEFLQNFLFYGLGPIGKL